MAHDESVPPSQSMELCLPSGQQYMYAYAFLYRDSKGSVRLRNIQSDERTHVWATTYEPGECRTSNRVGLPRPERGLLGHSQPGGNLARAPKSPGPTVIWWRHIWDRHDRSDCVVFYIFKNNVNGQPGRRETKWTTDRRLHDDRTAAVGEWGGSWLLEWEREHPPIGGSKSRRSSYRRYPPLDPVGLHLIKLMTL